MLTKQEKKEYRTLGKIILNGSIDEVNKITSRYLELNQKRYNPFYGRVTKCNDLSVFILSMADL